MSIKKKLKKLRSEIIELFDDKLAEFAENLTEEGSSDNEFKKLQEDVSRAFETHNGTLRDVDARLRKIEGYAERIGPQLSQLGKLSAIDFEREKRNILQQYESIDRRINSLSQRLFDLERKSEPEPDTDEYQDS